MSNGYEGRVLMQGAVEQEGDSADDQAVHHEGGGEGCEFCGNLSVHVNLLLFIEVFR
jgi:hypothetical protein